MCTVNIQVDEALLRDVKPELDSTAAIRLWAQELINLRIQELINEDEETMDIEEARAMVHITATILVPVVPEAPLRFPQSKRCLPTSCRCKAA